MLPRLALTACLIFAILIGTSRALARDWFVAVDGQDNQIGSADRPLLTIQSALNLAQAGDTITLRSGTYRVNNLRLASGGDKDRPLTIQAERGGRVIVTGSQRVTDWESIGDGKWRKRDWPTNSQMLTIDGHPLRQVGAKTPFNFQDTGDGNVCLPPVGNSIADLTPRRFFHDNASKTLYCMLDRGVDPHAAQMEASVSDRLFDGRDKSHVILRGLTFCYTNGTASGERSALVRVGGSDWIIEDCQFHNGDFAGLAISGDRHVIRRSVFHGNGCLAIDVNGSDAAHRFERYPERPSQDLLFEDLVITRNNSRSFYEYWHAGGIKLIPAARGVTIRRCTVLDNRGPGIWFDAALGNNVVEDNLVARNQTGINFEISSPGPDDRFGIRVRNNRIAFNREQGVYVSASQGAEIQNNTFCQNRWELVMHGMPRGTDTLQRNSVKQNVFCGQDADVIVFVGRDSQDNSVDQNLYARGGGQVRFGAVDHPGYDASHHELKSVQRLKWRYELRGISREVRWGDVKALDFKLEGVSYGWRAENGAPTPSPDVQLLQPGTR